jgi:hypothetical protein
MTTQEEAKTLVKKWHERYGSLIASGDADADVALVSLIVSVLEREREAETERREHQLAAAMKCGPEACEDCGADSSFMCWGHSRISEAFDPRVSSHPWLENIRSRRPTPQAPEAAPNRSDDIDPRPSQGED